MKTTYLLEAAELKSAIEMWMLARGTPVSDSDSFSVDASGIVTIVVENAPESKTRPISAPITPVHVWPTQVVGISGAPIVSPAATGSTDVASNPPISATSPNFEKAFAFVIKWEGSAYEDVSGDPGGPTKYGIDSKDHPSVDIRGLTLENAKQIYLTDYWQASNCDNLPSPVAETHFNFAVNVGREQSIKFMQRALGIVDDGQFGVATGAALAVAVPGTVALGMVDQADFFYRGLAAAHGMGKFLAGWLNRNSDLRILINS
jgi:hypothetical protein